MAAYLKSEEVLVFHLQSRNSVYFNYVDFCSKNGMTPVNAASFGKVAQTMTKRNTDNTVRV